MRLRLSALTHVVALVFAAYGLGLFLLGPSMTAIAATYRAPLVVVSLCYSAFSVGFLPFVFVGGYLYERVSRKWTVGIGAGLVSLGYFFFAAAPAVGPRPMIELALVGMAFVGMGAALLEVAVNALCAALNPNRPALAVNYPHMTLAVAAILGPWMSGQMMQRGLSWQWPYVIAGACALASLVALATQREPAVESAQRMEMADMRGLLRRGVLWVALAGAVLYVAAETGILGWVPTFMEKDLHASKAASCGVISAFWIAMTVGRMFCTWGASLLRPQVFVALLCGLGAAASAGIGAAHSQATAYVLVILSGLAFSGVFGMVLAHAAAELGRYLGAAYGIIICGVAIGPFFVPPAMGWIAEVYSMRLALIVPAALLAVATAVYLPLALRRPTPAAEPDAGVI